MGKVEATLCALESSQLAMLRALKSSKKTARGLANGSCNLLAFSSWEDLTESCDRTMEFLKSNTECHLEEYSEMIYGLEESFRTIKAFIQELLKMNTQTPEALLRVDELGNILELFSFVSKMTDLDVCQAVFEVFTTRNN